MSGGDWFFYAWLAVMALCVAFLAYNTFAHWWNANMAGPRRPLTGKEAARLDEEEGVIRCTCQWGDAQGRVNPTFPGELDPYCIVHGEPAGFPNAGEPFRVATDHGTDDGPGRAPYAREKPSA